MDELADIARGLRRRLEREPAGSGGELLAKSAASARRESRTAPTAAPVSRVREPATAAAVREPAIAPVVEAPAPAITNLFGEPEQEGKAKYEPLDFSLPSHHAPLDPIEAAERAGILTHSLPVLEEIAGEVRGCRKCGLCETRTNAVPGVGSASSGIVFVGEAPGADEDAQGEPFVGRAGQLLTRIIQAMDEAKLIPGVPLNRGTVYICNVLKCRPPENRNPLPHEIEQCSPYLHRQLAVLKPRIICCLGKFAAELLVGVKGT